MKLYRSLNMIFLIIFIIGTALCFKYLPSEIPLFMQSPSRWVFIGICFVILLALAIAAFFPHKISKNDNEVRNDITLIVINLFGLGIFLFYFVAIARYCGLQMNYMKGIALIVGGLMVLVGNFLPQMPYRSRIGFKLPWILKDKLCWQKAIDLPGTRQYLLGLFSVCLLCLCQITILYFCWELVFGLKLCVFIH